MEGIKFEFLMQMAIFTLENSLNASEDEIKRFKAAFENNVARIGAEMIKQIEASQQKYATNKTSNYIKN